MSSLPGGWRRGGVLAGVALLLALGALASAAVRPRAATPTIPAGPVAHQPGASSGVWSCAGPLPVAVAGTISALSLANYGRAPVSATVVAVSTAHQRDSEQLTISPGAQSVVHFPALTTRAFAAARVIASARTLDVVELAHSSSGPIAAPCQARSARTQYLVAGDTRRSDDVTVALYDPNATPAVANVTFTTASGPERPAAFQAVPVGPGEVVCLSLAGRLPFESELAMTVRSSGGAIVAGALDATSSHRAVLRSFETGVDVAAFSWHFPSSPAGPAATQTIDLYNPTTHAARVAIGFGVAKSASGITVAVPAGGVAHVPLAAEQSTRALRAATVTSSVPIVAGEELFVSSTIPQARLNERNPVLRRRRALMLVPTVPVGYAVSGGIHHPARRWLVAGGESDKDDSELVTVTNPSSHPVRVALSPLGGGRPLLGGLEIAADDSALVDLADLPAASGRLAVVVSSSSPVLVAGELYARRSVGFTSLAAIPLD